jgi:hypothetical protein
MSFLPKAFGIGSPQRLAEDGIFLKEGFWTSPDRSAASHGASQNDKN